MSSSKNTQPGLFFKLQQLLVESVAIWRDALKQERSRPLLKRGSEELEFLPAALEILETGASKTARFTIGLIITFLVVALLWSWFGQVATTAVASGRIIPSGHLKEIQSLEAGIVRAIHVKTGDWVEQGQVLIELDPTESEVDLNQIKHNLINSLVDYHRLETTLKVFSGENVTLTFPPEITDPLLLVEAQIQMDADLASMAAKLSQMDARQNELMARKSSLESEQDLISKMTPFVEEREAAYKALRNTAVSRERWIEVKQELLLQEQQAVKTDNQLSEIERALERNNADRIELIATMKRELIKQRNESKLQAEQAEITLQKLEKRSQNSVLRAPANGFVQQVDVHTIGGVVTPAQVLMTIVPDTAELEVEALIANKDIGFVHLNQDVAIKVESFPYTRYGYIDGTLSQYGADAIQHEQLGLVFPAKIRLHQDHIQVGDKLVRLQPGMQVQADIQTGHRRVLSYFLEPLLNYQQSSLRER